MMVVADWGSTPGQYYAIAYALTCCAMMLNSPKKIEKKPMWAIFGGFTILIIVWMKITHGITPWLFLPMMISILLLMWGAVSIVCKYNRTTALYFTFRAFIEGEFVASLEWQIFYYAVKMNILPQKMWAHILLMVLVDGSVIAGLYWLEKRNRELNETLSINHRELLSAGIITIAVYAASNISFIFEGVNLGPLVINQLFTVRTLVDLGGVGFLYAYHVQLAELNMRVAVERLQDMLEMQQNNYEILNQSVNLVNQKYHDLKYQIAVLKSEASAKDSLEYLEKMEQDIKAYEAQNKTGNKILDTILTGKSLYCQNNWIEMTSVADGTALEFMEPMDISILFGNMLDNAIESVMKIEEKEKRLIHVAVTKQKGFLRIRVENCYGEEPNIKNGKLVTSKKDKNYHGFGIKSIQSIVEKYDGSTNIHAEDGWFEIRILIPVREKLE